MRTLRPILLVEDNPNDAELTLTALDDSNVANPVDVTRDGAEALDYLYRQGAFAGREAVQPVVVLLDLKMPKVDGLDVLRRVKADETLRSIPIVMLTSSREESDLVASYQLGANAYEPKPINPESFLSTVRRLLSDRDSIKAA